MACHTAATRDPAAEAVVAVEQTGVVQADGVGSHSMPGSPVVVPGLGVARPSHMDLRFGAQAALDRRAVVVGLRQVVVRSMVAVASASLAVQQVVLEVVQSCAI